MRAIAISQPGPPEVLQLVELPDPVPGPDDLLVRNFAAGINRADLLQRRGLYPPPAGESEIPGLEFAGEVEGFGPRAAGFRIGDRVFGLVAGGAYAEKVRVDHRLVFRIPDRFSFDAAAAVPEAFLTAQESLVTLGRLAAGETVLIHAGASGVGTAAIQLASRRGAAVIVTAGSREKLRRCAELGAAAGICYRDEDFAARVAEITGGEGVHLILDFIGASYWDRNMACLRPGGRLVVLGLLGGAKASVNLGQVLMRRLQILGIAMRGLPPAEKLTIAERFRSQTLPHLESGALKPVLDRVLLLEEAAAAHQRMEENANVGKLVLRM
jgi:putative PIG3 family NAD(P)H quinone oxidoreductase